jgi:TetR/AcrR family transcriptional regulator, transcriptional repressor for nem operon
MKISRLTVRKEQKQQSRARILASAGQGFRVSGYGGLGIDGLAKRAGVTSGAFYGHFGSKAEAFRAAVTEGLQDVVRGVEASRNSAGASWKTDFVEFYLNQRRTCDLSESCAVQNMSADVERSDPETRQAYEDGLREIFEAMAKGMEGDPASKRGQSIALLALMTGGVSLARAVNDPGLSAEIAEAIRDAAVKLNAEHRSA